MCETTNISPDQAAAHAFLTELRTRIATQPLPYQDGVEARALQSLWELFGLAREITREYPGCQEFADKVTLILNTEIRPVTAKWHRAFEQGRLNAKDGANEFRGDLIDLQEKLRAFAKDLRMLAYGTNTDDELNRPAMSKAELDAHFVDLKFGIPAGGIEPSNKVDAINKAELEEVTARRNNHLIGTTTEMNAIGIGLSGGGIRSATFSLGVIQVLADKGLLKEVDFLSTVSGGGYTGSFLTARLGNKEVFETVAQPDGPDTNPIRYLRHHAKYLMGFSLKDRWLMVTGTVGGMILNWTAPFFVLGLLALVAVLFKNTFLDIVVWQDAMGCALAVVAFTLLVYGICLRGNWRINAWGGWILGSSVVVLAASCAGFLIVYGYDGFNQQLPVWISTHWAVSSLIGLAATVGPTIIRFVPIFKSPALRKIVLSVLLQVAGVVVPLIGVASFYALFYLGTLTTTDPSGTHNWGLETLIVVVAILGFVAFLVVNINLTSPHKLYRDRLAKSFVQKNENKPGSVPLKSINPAQSAPYHLINAALNLPSSNRVELRERKCDFFLFSKRFCGSPTTDYHETSKWKTNRSDADLATAMAISGAAVSSYMGLVSMPSLTALMTILNVRLGFWILSPMHKIRYGIPGFLCLVREMVGVCMSEKQAWLNLSDGGHIENMGVYELLRRRCKFIICVDGEADPDFTYVGLITLVRHAQIDFGIRIEMNMSEIKPDAKTTYSATHSLLCRIHYPGSKPGTEEIGLFLYLKLSVTGNESELIRRYRLIHPEFPHESTLDQFFDQEQFEAYRQLGVHVAKGLFDRAVAGNSRPKDVPTWFRGLAENLLHPRN